jgi:hypothetical protein
MTFGAAPPGRSRNSPFLSEITNSADGKQWNPSARIVQKGATRPAVQEEPAFANESCIGNAKVYSFKKDDLFRS